MGRIWELLDMSGRAVLITGGAGRVGQTAAETFSELGADVAVLDLHRDQCVAVCDRLSTEFAGQVLPIACDLEDASQTSSSVEAALRAFGRLDVLVNCAAFVGSSDLSGWTGDLSEQTADTFSRALAVNVTAPFVLSRAAARALGEGPCGRIHNQPVVDLRPGGPRHAALRRSAHGQPCWVRRQQGWHPSRRDWVT